MLGSRRTALRVIAAAAVLALAGSGCLHRAHRSKSTLPTKTARGEKVETGAPIYDEYFGTVHELNVLVATARLEDRDARSTLASMLGLLPTAPRDQILEKLRESAKTLPGMRLVVNDKAKPPTAKVVLSLPSPVDESVKGLIAVMEATATAELAISRRMGELPERAHRMHNVGDTLIDGAEKDFERRPAAERDQIDAELAASQDLLITLAQGSQDISDDTHAFVVHMQEALELSGSAAAREPGRSPSRPSGKKPRNRADDFNP